MASTSFSDIVLHWFDQHGRKHLPWQQNCTPYRVWVSEIMLQQTQVTTVIHYYQAFMTRFPTVQALAEAPEDDVLHHWSGLGYYSRARNLHKAAKMVVANFQGEFPLNVEGLQQLPGIGRSTAGAIASISMGLPAAIMDGNVKRVLTRCFEIEGWPGKSSVNQQLWELAESLTPLKRTGDYTQVMMDLGAMICKRSNPLCEQCPLNDRCLAFEHGTQKKFPESKPKTNKPERATLMAMVINAQHEVLLYKRPGTGIWGGLWSFPELALTTTTVHHPTLLQQLSKQLHIYANSTEIWPSFRHTFSHYHLDITPVLIHCDVSEPAIGQWFSLSELPQLGLAAPVKRLLDGLLANHNATLCAAKSASAE